MKWGILVVGIALVLVSAVFLAIPLFSQPNCSGTVGNGATSTGPHPVACRVTTFLVPLNLAVSWTSSAPGTLVLEICTGMTTTNASGTPQSQLAGCTNSFNESASAPSGGGGTTPTISIGNGDYLVVSYVPQSGNAGASFSSKTTLPQVGLPVLLVGAIVVAAGLLMRKPPVRELERAGPPPPPKPIEGI